MKLEYKVERKQVINDILIKHFKFSNNFIKFLKRNKLILLNDQNVYVTQMAEEGDVVAIVLDYEEDSDNIVPSKIELDIVYEDEYLIIINKPAEYAIHPSMNHYENSIANGLKYYYNEKGLNIKIRPVNRLDKDTSGLVIFAKFPFIQEELSKQMREGTFKKYYLGIIEGKLKSREGVIELPIVRKPGSIIERMVDVKCKEQKAQAITEYKVIKEKDNLSLVEFKLLTGRTHQIRVHTSYLGCPLLGDTLYGKASDLIKGQALHSYKIEFIHPITNELLVFERQPEFIKIID